MGNNESSVDKTFDIVSKPSIDVISGYARLSRFFGNGPTLRLMIQEINATRRYAVSIRIVSAVAVDSNFDDFIITGQLIEITRLGDSFYDIGTEISCHISYGKQDTNSLTVIPRRG